MAALGWEELDILLISGDAYVDHPSFGTAILGRWLVHHGYRVGVVAQPRWTAPDDLKVMGRPRLFAGVTAGALDSMVAHYTAFRKKRNDDAYTSGGVAGKRPNRACIVYSSLVKQAFPKLPIVLGGIEASLRRTSHYDFWTDQIRRPIILDAKADVVLYGMAERGILELAQHVEDAQDMYGVSGAAFMGESPGGDVMVLPAHEEIATDPRKLMEATLATERHVLHANQVAVQQVEGRTLVMTAPRPLSGPELDALYALPFTRDPHQSYVQPIPAADMIRFSMTSHRGCAGGCSFCTLAAHQGRTIKSRSGKSLLDEATVFTHHPKWNGSITDVGGPSANMWGGACSDDPSQCQRASCVSPGICPHFIVDQMQMLELLDEMKQVPKMKHVRIASGVRYDLALQDRKYISALVRDYVGGQLKIAPEHFSDQVLRLMRKPNQKVFEQFLDIFDQECKAAGKEQYVIPYLLTAFPGCTSRDMEYLADWLKRRGWRPQQVQCFIPLPGTVAAAMYHAGIDTQGRPIYVPKSDAERLRQHYMIAPQDEARRSPPGRADERYRKH